MEDEEEFTMVSLDQLLWAIPLFDNLFLSMQGQNIMLIDFHIRDLQTELLREYVKIERTPSQSALFVSAMSQMWLFSVYELLRTWRQFVKYLKAGKSYKAASDDLSQNLSQMFWQKYEIQFQSDAAFRAEIDAATAEIEPVFRMVESLRMNLAKHEVPKKKLALASSPGYGRIDMSNGSIEWMVELGDNEVEIISRRDVSDALRASVIRDKS